MKHIRECTECKGSTNLGYSYVNGKITKFKGLSVCKKCVLTFAHQELDVAPVLAIKEMGEVEFGDNILDSYVVWEIDDQHNNYSCCVFFNNGKVIPLTKSIQLNITNQRLKEVLNLISIFS